MLQATQSVVLGHGGPSKVVRHTKLAPQNLNAQSVNNNPHTEEHGEETDLSAAWVWGEGAGKFPPDLLPQAGPPEGCILHSGHL